MFPVQIPLPVLHFFFPSTGSVSFLLLFHKIMEYDTDDLALPDELVVQYKHNALILQGITAIVSTKSPRKIVSAFPD